MKVFARFFLAMVLCAGMSCAGCALLTPPPFVKAEMDVVKGPDGKVLGAHYSRSVSGFTNAEPNTVIGDWSTASGNPGLGVVFNPPPEDASYCQGRVINRTGSPRTAEIYRKGSKKPYKILSFDKVREIDAVLPYGEYITVWWKGREAVEGRPFEVRPGKTVKLDNEEMGWVQILNP